MKKTISIMGSLALCLALAGTGLAQDTTSQRISLREAVDQALANNLNLQLLQDEVEIAAGNSQAARGKFDVTLGAEAGVQNQEYTPLAPGGAEEETTGSWKAEASKLLTTGTALSLGWNNGSYDSDTQGLLFNPSYNSGLVFGLKQSLLKGFGNEVQTADLQAAERQMEAASFTVNSQAANLAAEVKQAYWSLVFAWQDIEVRRLSLKLAQKLLEETEAKINAGKLAPVELYQPQSEVARREEQLISAERAIGVAEDQLKLLLNYQDWLVNFEPTDQPETEPVVLNLNTILDNALENRPDVKAAALQAEAARLQVVSASDNTRPDLALVGNLGVGATRDDYGDSLNDSVSDPENLWQVGLAFSMPLENSAAKGLQRQAKARYSQAEKSIQLLKQQVRQTVRTTIRDVELAIKALEATRKTSLATLKRLEAEEAKFDSGRATTLDVLAAQDAYSQALSQENQTNIAYANTLAELDRIQGLVTFSSAR